MTDNNTDKKRISEARPEAELKRGRRGKRKADVVRPGILYKIVDAIVTVAAMALIAAVLMYVFMIFG